MHSATPQRAHAGTADGLPRHGFNAVTRLSAKRKVRQVRRAKQADDPTKAAIHRAAAAREGEDVAEAVDKGKELRRRLLLAKLGRASRTAEVWALSKLLAAAETDAPLSAADNLRGDDGAELPSDAAKAAYAANKWAEVGADTHTNAAAQRWRDELRNITAANNTTISSRPQPAAGINRPWVRAELERALKKGAKRSAPGPDGLTYVFLRALDATAWDRLLGVFNLILRTGETPESWAAAAVGLLAKPGRDLALWNNYRCIALTSVVCKTFERMLVARLQPHIEASGGIHDRQHGFRKTYACYDAVLALSAAVGMGLTAAAAQQHGPKYSCFCDVRRAYPAMFRPAALARLHRQGAVDGEMLRVITNMFQSVRSAITVGAATAPEYEITTGAREGSSFSPLLYSVYIDGIIEAALSATVPCGPGAGQPAGTVIGNYTDMTFGAALFADDFCMTSDTPEGLQAMMTAAGNYANEHVFHFARDKTNVVCFGDDTERTWTMPALYEARKGGSSSIQQKQQYEYLGMLMHSSRSWKPHHAAKVAKFRSLKLVGLRDRGTGAFGAGGKAGAAITRALLAGAVDGNAIVTAASDANTASQKELTAIKMLCSEVAANEAGGGRGKNPPETAMLAEIDMAITAQRRAEEVAMAHARIMNLPPERLVRKIVERAAEANSVLGKRARDAITKACSDAGTAMGHPSGIPTYCRNKVLRNNVSTQYAERARVHAINHEQDQFPAAVHRRRQTVHGTKCPPMAPRRQYDSAYCLLRQITSSSHHFNACVHGGPAASPKACPHCGHEHEDAVHVLAVCPEYHDARQVLIERTKWPAAVPGWKDAVAWAALDHTACAVMPALLQDAVLQFLDAVVRKRYDR
jgi:hypothetical protein